MGNSFSLPASISNTPSSSFIYKNINFEDMQTVINNNYDTIIINTLDLTNQKCLIEGTIQIDHETKIVNEQLEKNKSIRIIVYGMNSTDETIVKKYDQLISLGFTNVYIYLGGLFEWLLLQDIYGQSIFPTTSIEKDLLKYKGRQQFNIRLLKN
jgi:hypothetical protein